MEWVTVNAGKVRQVVLNDRLYFVAPLTMIVPGVLNGSNGPLLYPQHEIQRNVIDWNGIPLVAGHPQKDGNHVSARTPEVLANGEIGRVYQAMAPDGVLRAEGWFDAKATQRIDNRIYLKLLKGEPLELSTGLHTDNEPAPQGATFNGHPYSYTARNYRPDHLAVLIDQKGACSLADGCGVLVNEARPFQKAGKWLSKHGLMPGYGQVFVKDGEVWYVGGDGDERGFSKLVQETLSGLRGVSKVTYEAEEFPPRGEGWEQVYPEEATWNSEEPCECNDPDCEKCKTRNANPEGCNQYKDCEGGEEASQKEGSSSEDLEKAKQEHASGVKSLYRLTFGPALGAKLEQMEAKADKMSPGYGQDELMDKVNEMMESRVGPNKFNQFAGAKRRLDERLGEAERKQTENAKPGQPRSQVSGHYKPMNSGTGKGEAHEAAQRGHMVLTDRDRELGADAKAQLEASGDNPASWVEDEGKWERAKGEADKGGYEGDAYWPVVAHIYQKMGGTVKDNKDIAENANPEGCNQHTGSECSGGGEEKATGHGNRASAARGFREQMVAAKEQLKSAFDGAKADAAKADENAQESYSVIWEKQDKTVAVESTPLYSSIEELNTAIATHDDSLSPAVRYKSFGKIAQIAAKAQRKNSTAELGTGVDDLSKAEQKRNDGHLTEIIKHAESARGKLREYVQYRKEMRAIRQGTDITGNESDLTADDEAILETVKDRDITENETTEISNQGESPMNRNELINYLTTNCSHWKGRETVLNSLDDKGLQLLIEAAKEQLAERAVVNSLRETVPALAGLTVNAMPDFIKKKIEAKEDKEEAKNKKTKNADDEEWEEEDEEEEMTESKKAKNKKTKNMGAAEGAKYSGALEWAEDQDMDNPESVAGAIAAKNQAAHNQRRPQTMKEWEAAMPREARAVWNAAKEIEKNERGRLVQQLTRHVTDEALRHRLTANHLKKPLTVLRDEVAALPLVSNAQDGDDGDSRFSGRDSGNLFINYFGGQGGPVTANETDMEPMDLDAKRQEFIANEMKEYKERQRRA